MDERKVKRGWRVKRTVVIRGTIERGPFALGPALFEVRALNVHEAICSVRADLMHNYGYTTDEALAAHLVVDHVIARNGDITYKADDSTVTPAQALRTIGYCKHSGRPSPNWDCDTCKAERAAERALQLAVAK